MTPKEWAIQAFEMCDHGGMICMDCAEQAISAAIEEERKRWLCEVRDQNGDVAREVVPRKFASSK
jgi:hypothetical protein